MSQDHLIKLQCTETKRITYWTRKNRKSVQEKLELMKYNPTLRKHTLHKEAKK